MEAFAEEKGTWLRGFLELPKGIEMLALVDARFVNDNFREGESGTGKIHMSPISTGEDGSNTPTRWQPLA